LPAKNIILAVAFLTYGKGKYFLLLLLG